MSIHDAQQPYARHPAPQHDSIPWSASGLYASTDIDPSSGSVATACSSPDGVADYPMNESHQHQFYSSLHNALASGSAPSNAPATTSSSAYSTMGLPTFSAASPSQRQSGAPFGAMSSIYSPSTSRSAREWHDSLIVMDDADPEDVSAYPNFLDSSTGDLYRRGVAVKHEPEDADIGGIQQQRQRPHFVMEPHQQHQHTSYTHAHSLSPGSGTTSHPHPPPSPPQAGLSSPLSPLSPTGAGTLSPGARAPATPASVLADAFRGTTQSILNNSPFSAFSSAGGVAGASVFDGSGGGGDMQASGFTSQQPEPILPHAMTAPLRAVNASKEMRRMMGVFRLNPFTMMNGAPVPSAWDGSEAGPLESEPVQLEFRVYFEGMLIEDEDEEGATGSAGGRTVQEYDEDVNEDAYDVPGPSAASQAYAGSRRGYGHPQRDSLVTRNASPPNLNAYGLRNPGMGATANSRTIFDRDLERQREMRSGSFGSPSSSSMAQYHQNGRINTMNTSPGAFNALLRPRSALSAPVSDGLSDSSTAVSAAPDAGVPADSSFLDMDSRPHSQGSFSSVYPSISTAYANTSPQTQAQQTALRTQSHGLFRGASAVLNGSGGTSLFTPTPAALAAEMHLSLRARQMYNANRVRHGSLSSNRSELSGSASPPVNVSGMHGSDYHHRSPHQHQNQNQQHRNARNAAHPYHPTSNAQHVPLDLGVLSPGGGIAGAGASFIGPGQGGGEPARHYVSDHSNSTAFSLTSASFTSGFDGTSNDHGHVSPVSHGPGISRRWQDATSVQRVYS